MPALSPSPPPAYFGGTSVLQGVVFDAETGKPIPDATLYLKTARVSEEGGMDEFRAVFRTGPDGTFRIAGLSPRRYQIDAEAGGYLRHVGLVYEALAQLDSGKDEPSDSAQSALDGYWYGSWGENAPYRRLLESVMPLVAEGDPAQLVIRLVRGRRIRGTVTDPDRQPISGAVVEISDQSVGGYQIARRCWTTLTFPPNRPVLTDSDGRYEITVHPSLVARVRACAPSRLFESLLVDARAHEGPLDFILHEGRSMRLVLQAPSTLQYPWVGAFVPRVGGQVFHPEPQPDGSFLFDALPPGPLVVYAAEQLYGAAARYLEQAPQTLELSLLPIRRLQGLVLDSEARPLAGAYVWQQHLLSCPAGLIHLGHSERGEFLVEWPEQKEIHAPIDLPFHGVKTDERGRFGLDTVLDENGRVLISAMFTSIASFHHLEFRGWVDLSQEAVLRLSPKYPPTTPSSSPEPALSSEPAPEISPRAPVEEWISNLKNFPATIRRKLIFELREAASSSKATGGRPDLVPVFVSALSNEDKEVRLQAVLALSDMNHPAALDPLLEALGHSDSMVRYFSVPGLESLGLLSHLKPRIVERLRSKALGQDSWFDVPLSAAAALVDLGEWSDPEIFFRALRGEASNPSIACRALVALGRRDAIELLIESLDGESTASLAADALRKLSGEPLLLRDDPAPWRAWLDSHRSSLPPQAPPIENPSDPQSWVRRARRRANSSQHALAAQDYTRALDLDPRSAEILLERADCRSALEDFDGARADLDRAIELDPLSVPAYFARARLSYLRGPLDSAISDLRRVIELAPAAPTPRYSLARCLKKKGDLRAAISSALSALDLGGSKWRQNEALLNLLSQLGVASIPFEPRPPDCSSCSSRQAEWTLTTDETTRPLCGPCLSRGS